LKGDADDELDEEYLRDPNLVAKPHKEVRSSKT
jgi:hypothetical protein